MFINRFGLLLFGLIFLMGCKEDLLPSNDPIVDTSTVKQGDVINDFSFILTNSHEQPLSDTLSTHDAVVLYFTMWCPVCDSHMSHIRTELKNAYPNVKFLLVDYVSGSVAYALDAQMASGYGDFDVIADYDNQLENLFNGTMASTIVIDKNFIVRYKGLFKTSDEIEKTLDNL